jgi:sigma-54 dependent transcriptional regulator, acetoin dehydrogenase operon transcriptional activator AcoR
MHEDRSAAPFFSPSPPDWARCAGPLREAWQAFVAVGRTPPAALVRPAILSRWRAAQEWRIDPALCRVPIVATEDEIEEVLGEDEFGAAGSRVLDGMAELVADTGHSLLLSDAGGCVLHVTGATGVIRSLRELNLRVGGSWDEPVAGPNGIGSALRSGRSEIVYGAEHFCERWHDWVCYGAVVRDPLDGGLLGAVDLTGRADAARVNLLPLAESVARSIESLLVPVRARARRILVDAAEHARRRFPSDVVVACDAAGPIDGAKVDAAIRAALDELGGTTALRELVRSGPDVELELPRSGLRVAARPVRGGGRQLGAVLSFRPLGRPAPAPPSPSFPGLEGEEPEFRAALRLIARAARSEETVLLVGESGTGKELVARAIHELGPRAKKPLVAVNCAALPRDLAAAELFGYERGAFTGAHPAGKPGRFEMAHEGTLFLDEIGELPLELQGILLRVLDDRSVEPLGGRGTRRLDVRVVAATNRDLERAVEEGSFRLDLYHRLSVLEVSLPPLRSRRADLLPLARRFVAEACARLRRPSPRLSDDVAEALLRYDWPGNVRELRNVAAHVAHWCEGDAVEPSDLPARILRRRGSTGSSRPQSLRELEGDAVERALAACRGNAAEAARRLGIHRSTVYRLRKRTRPDGEV